MSRLVYIIGPSGAGKDTLLRELREHATPGERLLVAHRYITRPADAGGENHIAVTDAEYEQRLGAGLFALAWESHGYRYGIGVEVDQWLGLGFDVAVNGSRAYLPRARDRYPELLAVMIRVSTRVLRQRMGQRGRETDAEMEARLARGRDYELLGCPGLVCIDNDCAITDTARQLREAIHSTAASSDLPRPAQSKRKSTTSAR